MDLTMIGVPKPRKDITEFRYRKLKNILIQRKWDGCCVFGITGNGIYSRRTSSVTGRKISYTNKFPHISEELDKTKLPKNSVVVGEMVWTKDGRDLPTSIENFRILQRITGSSDSTSRKLQAKFGSPIWIIFDLLILENEPAYLLPYKTRFEVLKNTIGSKYIRLVKNLNLGIEDAYKMAKNYGWEGLVLKDPEAPTEIIENDINNGIVRPDGYWKMKPKREADVIIKGLEFSKKDKNRVASLVAFLKDSNSGKLRYVGKVGSFEGFSWRFRYDLAKASGKFNGLFFELDKPFTAKVRFDAWSKDGKMLKPVFFSPSHKAIDECTTQNELIEWRQ